MTRGLGAVLLWVAIGAPGCSLIYDADEFVVAADAAPPAPDVDLGALDLFGTDQEYVLEGAGAVRAIPIVIGGTSISSTATVTLDGAGFDAVDVTPSVSSDGKWLAFELAIPVMPELPSGMSETLTVTVAQDGVSDFLEINIVGLDEYQASVDAAGGTQDTADLAAPYSTIQIDAPIALVGDEGARFIATALIEIDATVDASGADSTGTAGGAGGPGGCAGGAVEAPGGCSTGGGRAGGNSAGGGGGGHAGMGDQGVSAGGGPGGAATGTDELVPLRDDGGNGGGGGGPGVLLGMGGGGGGGGGIIEITTDGVLRVSDAAMVTADGGAGHGGTGSCSVLDQHGGGGGGGAGGALLVRSRGQMIDEGTGARLSATAGEGGADGGDNDCNGGGRGAAGRIRVDVPSADAPPSFATGATFRGPVLSPDTPAIVTTSPITLELFGEPGVTYDVERLSDERRTVVPNAGRVGTVELPLRPGSNTVCALTHDAIAISSDATNCIDIAYIP